MANVLYPTRVGNVSAETRFKRVAGAVGKEGGHTGGAETGVWWLDVAEVYQNGCSLTILRRVRHTLSNG